MTEQNNIKNTSDAMPVISGKFMFLEDQLFEILQSQYLDCERYFYFFILESF